MRPKISKIFLALSLSVLLPIAGCNHYADAQNTVAVIGEIISTAQSDLPSLEAAGLFSATEATAVTNYLNGAQKLDVQTGTCLASIGANGAKAALLACFTAFASGLVSPAELADLRILNPKAQAKVQLWVTAISLAINTGAAFFGGAATPAPQIAALPTSRSELAAFKSRIDLSAFGE
jgi:hypothetical protein